MSPPARTTGSFGDLEALARFAATVDAVTYEFENIPLETVKFLEGIVPVQSRGQGAGLCARSSEREAASP